MTAIAKPLSFVAFVTCALAFSACSSEPAAQQPNQGGTGGGGSETAGKSGGGSAPEACPAGPHPESDTEPVEVGVVSAKLVDEQGEPTTAGLVQVCAKNVCIDAAVSSDGELAQELNQSMNAPACKFGNGKEWGKLAVPVGAGDTELGTLTTVRLPAYADGAFLRVGQAASSAGVTLTLADDARIEIDTLTYVEESKQTFRAAALPAAALEQLKQDFVLGYALAPLETVLCPSPALSIENTTELEPGSELELFVLGLDVAEAWAPYAGWEKVGEGSVSDDGQTLEFPDGLPLLTAIGIREKR